MKLKFFLIIGFSVLLSCTVQGQEKESTQNEEKAVSANNLKEKFTSDISNYLDAFNKGNWEGVINMIYPKLFELLTKEQMIETFNQMAEMGMEVKTDFHNVEKISTVIMKEGSKFCRVYYDASLAIKISGTMLENKNQLEESFKAAYGADNLEFNETNNTFEIEAKKSMIAISDTDSNKWTYLEYSNQQDEMLKQLISEKVLKQIAE